MHIGEVARRTGVTADAIRFYERSGVLTKPQRSEGGYRLYESESVASVLFLRRAQALGFSLSQVRELISLRRGRRPCMQVRDRLRRKLAEVRTKIRELKHLEDELHAAQSRCERQIRRHTARCPLLDASGQKTGRKPR